MILLAIIPVILMSIVILFKDKDFGWKYRFAFKLFFAMIINIGAMYLYKGTLGAILGLCCSIITLSSFDKNYNDRFIVEAIKVIVMQLLVGVAAYYSNYNYIGLIIISLITVFIIYYIFTHNGKASRTSGFLMTYIILVHLNIGHAQYNNVFKILFLSTLLAVLVYYFFHRDSHFKDNNLFNGNFLTTASSFKNFIEAVDRDIEFSMFKLRYSILTAIAVTGAIFYMQYYSTNESIWVLVSIVVMLVPDQDTSGRKIIDRIIGTIIGAIVFTILNKFIPYEIITYLLAALSLYFAFFPMGYQNNAVLITYFTLSLHTMFSKQYSPYYLDKYRIGFTIVGGIVVFIIFLIEKRFKEEITNATRLKELEAKAIVVSEEL
jgi:hypothetical protein